jgi:hypothetical protein
MRLKTRPVALQQRRVQGCSASDFMRPDRCGTCDGVVIGPRAGTPARSLVILPSRLAHQPSTVQQPSAARPVRPVLFALCARAIRIAHASHLRRFAVGILYRVHSSAACSPRPYR